MMAEEARRQREAWPSQARRTLDASRKSSPSETSHRVRHRKTKSLFERPALRSCQASANYSRALTWNYGYCGASLNRADSDDSSRSRRQRALLEPCHVHITFTMDRPTLHQSHGDDVTKVWPELVFTLCSKSLKQQ